VADLTKHFAVEDRERQGEEKPPTVDIEDLRAAVGLEGER
jgi:hypothetical protein